MLWTDTATLYCDPTDLKSMELILLAKVKEAPVKIVFLDNDWQPRFSTVNPKGLLPFLTDKMLFLSSPATISTYIDERFPAPALLPQDTKARATIRQITGEIRDWYGMQEVVDWKLNAVADFETFVTKEWLLSAELCKADIALAPILWSLRGHLSGLKNVAAYSERIFSTPWFRAALKELHAYDQSKIATRRVVRRKQKTL